MKRTLLFVLALAVIPVGVDTQVFSLEEIRPLADQGDVRAQFILGVMYSNGEGVPEDDVLAYMWWNLAASQEDEDAQGNEDSVEERMTRE